MSIIYLQLSIVTRRLFWEKAMLKHTTILRNGKILELLKVEQEETQRAIT